jgi:hypothetical protein
MLLLELQEEVRLESSGGSDRVGHREPELEGTARGADALPHHDVRGLRGTRVKVLAHPPSKPVPVSSTPNVRDVGSTLGSWLRLREPDHVDARGRRKGGEKLTLSEVREGKPV